MRCDAHDGLVDGRLSDRFCETLARVIVHDPTFAVEHEVEQYLWRCAFYEPIERARKRLRKAAAAAVTAPGGSGVAERAQARTRLHRAVTAFTGVIGEAKVRAVARPYHLCRSSSSSGSRSVSW